VIAGLGLGMLTFGCGHHQAATQPGPDIALAEQGTAALCLSTLRQAYIDRDSTQYRRLFTDDFIFVFSVVDASRPDNPTPPSWLLSDELRSAGRMFRSDKVTRIELSFDPSPDTQSQEVPGTWLVRFTHVQLLVYTFADDGSPLILKVTDGKATFYFKETVRASDGKSIWTIARWKDEVLTDKGTNSSWGQIKHGYWSR